MLKDLGLPELSNKSSVKGHGQVRDKTIPRDNHVQYI